MTDATNNPDIILTPLESPNGLTGYAAENSVDATTTEFLEALSFLDPDEWAK